MSAETNPISTFDQLVQLLDSLQGDRVAVDAGIEASMAGLEGVTAKGVLRRRRGEPWNDSPGMPRSPHYDLYHGGQSIGDFSVDELYFTAAELWLYDTGQDYPRLFITQDVWRLGEGGQLPSHRLKLVVWLLDRLSLDLPTGEGEEVAS